MEKESGKSWDTHFWRFLKSEEKWILSPTSFPARPQALILTTGSSSSGTGAASTLNATAAAAAASGLSSGHYSPGEFGVMGAAVCLFVCLY